MQEGFLYVPIAENCLAHTLDYIVMQMSKTNREKGYCHPPTLTLNLKQQQ